MKRKKWALALAFLVVAVLSAGIGVYAATSYGTEADPLVTLSYLEDTLTPLLIGKMQEKLDIRAEELEREIANADTYAVVTLTQGQRLTGAAGCEFLLRSGDAVCIAASASAVADLSRGDVLRDGADVAANHLYLVTVDGSGLMALEDVKLLAHGDYTVE